MENYKVDSLAMTPIQKIRLISKKYVYLCCESMKPTQDPFDSISRRRTGTLYPWREKSFTNF